MASTKKDPLLFSSEGQRLLVQHRLTPSELARVAGVQPPLVSAWRSGLNRPSAAPRRALEVGAGIPATSWDCPPTMASPASSTTTKAPATSPASKTIPGASSADGASTVELESYGIEGLEALVDRLREQAPLLPPRERVAAINSEGRLHQTIAAMRLKQHDARAAYLGGHEFQEDAKLLAAALPGGAEEFRAALSRLGVKLPAPAVQTANVRRPPPRTRRDVETLITELEGASIWVKRGEPYLAMERVMALAIDAHAEHIAAILADDTELAGRFLPLLGASDAQIVNTSLERRLALSDIRSLTDSDRRLVANLLTAFGLSEVAKTVEGI